MKYNINFETSHHQFYIVDKNLYNVESTGDETFWTESAFNDRLASHKSILGIGTQCYGNVKGELIILDKPSIISDYSKYDHIVEAGLSLGSGHLQVLDCPNSAVVLEIELKPGDYKVRVYSSNLASVIDDDGEDYYKIEIWKSDDMERKVLKKFVAIPAPEK